MKLNVEVGLCPNHSVTRDPAPLPQRSKKQSPNFWSMSVVAKQSPITASTESAIAEMGDRLATTVLSTC